MKIKKFRAKSFSEALKLVKKELGQDAVILSSEEIKGILNHVEVTAAIDENFNSYHTVNLNKTQYKIESELTEKVENKKDSHSITDLIETSVVRDIKTEIEQIKTEMSNLKNLGLEISISPSKRELFKYLSERAFREEFALSLSSKSESIQDIYSIIAEDLSIKGDSRTKRAVMLIGPTGVGKTTTIAKLSAHLVKKGRSTAIINHDTYRIGAVEQMKIYSKILGVPLSVTSNTSEFRQSLKNFSDTKDVVFIDTTGRNPRDVKYINQLQEMLKSDIPIETHLLFSANTDDAFVSESVKYYKSLPIDYIMFTKIDEAYRYGSLYNIYSTFKKPISYITTGQSVPGDIEKLDVKSLAGLILTKGCFRC